MANKVVNYYRQPHGEYQLGFCNVDIGGKCALILKVCKSRHGNIYCAFNSVKINEKWLSDFSFIDRDYERTFLSKCLEQVKPLIAESDKSIRDIDGHETEIEPDPFQ